MRPRRQQAGSARGAKGAHKKCEVDKGEVKKSFSLFSFPFSLLFSPSDDASSVPRSSADVDGRWFVRHLSLC
jgi:hypothetical protein